MHSELKSEKKPPNSKSEVAIFTGHSLILGVLIQSRSAGAKNFTKCVFYHVQFSGVIQNIAYHAV